MITACKPEISDIVEVMFDPEIFDRTNPDGTVQVKPCDLYKANFDGWNFIGGYVDGKIASLFIVKDRQMHFWVLKPFRKYSRELLDRSFGLWPYDVWCKIPSLYKTVINFAKNYGFEETDIEPDCYSKDGKLYDMHILEFKWVE